MRIGLLGLEDPSDVRSYSGTPYHLAHYLRLAGNEIQSLGPYPVSKTRARIEDRLLQAFTGKRTIQERHPSIVRQYPVIINKYLQQYPDLDVLLATSAFLLGSAQADVPLVFWGDTTFAGVLGSYARYHNLSARTVADCHAAEQYALTSCDLAIFSSQWAANVATASYSVDSSKVRVITYGANLIETPTESDIARFLTLRNPGVIDLILIGASWERKGVEKAIATVEELRDRGLNARLLVLGCYPPQGRVVPEYVSVLGIISKRTPEGRAQFGEVVGASHLLILPTVAECAAVVLAEASAFGLPVLTSDVGGNASLVHADLNGHLLPLEASASEWADAAQGICGAGKDSYEEAAWRAFRFFHQELSWERAVDRFSVEVRALLGTKKGHEHALSAS